MAIDNTALVRRNETIPAAEVSAPFEPADLGQALALATSLAQASLLPAYLRGKPADVFMTLLLGRDLGLTAMQAITGIHVIEGKPSVSAQTAVALVKRSPLCAFFRQVESTDAIATYETQRKGEAAPQRLSYSIEDARRAGLGGKQNWQRFPSAMLRARAAMALARDVYPDVVANIYDPDELDDAVHRAEAQSVTAPPPPSSPTAAPARKPPMPAPPARAPSGPGPTVRAKAEAIEAELAARDAKAKAEDEAAIDALGKSMPPINMSADADVDGWPDRKPKPQTRPVQPGDEAFGPVDRPDTEPLLVAIGVARSTDDLAAILPDIAALPKVMRSEAAEELAARAIGMYARCETEADGALQAAIWDLLLETHKVAPLHAATRERAKAADAAARKAVGG